MAKKFSDEEIKHLEFIQGVITRMGANSFQIKGWMITLVSAFIGIYASTGNDKFALAGLFPTLLFWFLDTYYLWQERKFRGVYNGVIKKDKRISPFTMPVNLYTDKTDKQFSFTDTFWSVTISPLYLSVIVILLGIYFLL